MTTLSLTDKFLQNYYIFLEKYNLAELCDVTLWKTALWEPIFIKTIDTKSQRIGLLTFLIPAVFLIDLKNSVPRIENIPFWILIKANIYLYFLLKV